MRKNGIWKALAVVAVGAGSVGLVYSHPHRTDGGFPVLINGRVLSVEDHSFRMRRNTTLGNMSQEVTVFLERPAQIRWGDGTPARFEDIGVGGKVLVRGMWHNVELAEAERIAITSPGIRPAEAPAPAPAMHPEPPAPPAPPNPPPAPPADPPANQGGSQAGPAENPPAEVDPQPTPDTRPGPRARRFVIRRGM